LHAFRNVDDSQLNINAKRQSNGQNGSSAEYSNLLGQGLKYFFCPKIICVCALFLKNNCFQNKKPYKMKKIIQMHKSYLVIPKFGYQIVGIESAFSSHKFQKLL